MKRIIFVLLAVSIVCSLGQTERYTWGGMDIDCNNKTSNPVIAVLHEVLAETPSEKDSSGVKTLIEVIKYNKTLIINREILKAADVPDKQVDEVLSSLNLKE